MTRPLPVVAGENAELLGADVHYLPGADEPLTELAPDGLHAHRLRFGRTARLHGRDGRALLGIMDDVELTGRGGGHFPVARKWREVLKAARLRAVPGRRRERCRGRAAEPQGHRPARTAPAPRPRRARLAPPRRSAPTAAVLLAARRRAPRARRRSPARSPSAAELGRPARRGRVRPVEVPVRRVERGRQRAVRARSPAEPRPRADRAPRRRRASHPRAERRDPGPGRAAGARLRSPTPSWSPWPRRRHSVVAEFPATTTVAAAVCHTIGGGPAAVRGARRRLRRAMADLARGDAATPIAGRRRGRARPARARAVRAGAHGADRRVPGRQRRAPVRAVPVRAAGDRAVDARPGRRLGATARPRRAAALPRRDRRAWRVPPPRRRRCRWCAARCTCSPTTSRRTCAGTAVAGEDAMSDACGAKG